MGKSLPAEVSEFLVNALKSHDDDEGCDGRKEEDWREQKKTVSEEGGTLDQSGASTYGYVFVWKRREKKKKEGGSGRAGV